MDLKIIATIVIIGLIVWVFFFQDDKPPELADDAPVPAPDPFAIYQGLAPYGSGEPENWGSFAQAIKVHTKEADDSLRYTTNLNVVYNRHVDIVRGFFKRRNVKPTGEYVSLLKNEINAYIRGGGLKYYEF
jgi:hypothetical protein